MLDQVHPLDRMFFTFHFVAYLVSTPENQLRPSSPLSLRSSDQNQSQLLGTVLHRTKRSFVSLDPPIPILHHNNAKRDLKHLLVTCSLIGPTSFLALYLGGGIISSLVSLGWHRAVTGGRGPKRGSEGASGKSWSSASKHSMHSPLTSSSNHRCNLRIFELLRYHLPDAAVPVVLCCSSARLGGCWWYIRGERQ